MKKQSYFKLSSEEKKLSITLKLVRNEKQKLRIGYKNCSSTKDKFLFIINNLRTATYDEFLNELLFLDTSLTFSDAVVFIEKNSQKLLDENKLGLIKNKNKYGFYILDM